MREAEHSGQGILLVGLTGGIGSGKTTVARRFAELGAAVVDADAIAREIVEPGEPALEELEDRFGPGILDEDGTLDRAGLAAIVFDDEDARAALNEITHPRIGERLMARVAELKRDPPDSRIVVLDVPLLTESTALAQQHDVVVVVEAPEDLRVERVVTSRDMTEPQVRARIRAQQTDEERRRLATHVIDNRGNLADLHEQVDEIYQELREQARTGGTAGPSHEADVG